MSDEQDKSTELPDKPIEGPEAFNFFNEEEDDSDFRMVDKEEFADPPKTKEEQEEAEAKEDIPAPAGQWRSTPSRPDQIEHEGAWRMGPPLVEVLDLKESDQLEKYRGILRRTHPPGAPQVAVVENHKHFHEHHLTVVLTYHEIEYLYLPTK